jgi:hypothetical protein
MVLDYILNVHETKAVSIYIWYIQDISSYLFQNFSKHKPLMVN